MIRAPVILLVSVCAAGCAPVTPVNISGAGTQLEARQIQSRQYETLDKAMTMRSVIATLQDLGFTIDQADAELGVVTATRYDQAAAYQQQTMRMTITVVQRGEERVSVRANARIGETAVSSAATYQDFFAALDKAMFLTRESID